MQPYTTQTTSNLSIHRQQTSTTQASLSYNATSYIIHGWIQQSSRTLQLLQTQSKLLQFCAFHQAQTATYPQHAHTLFAKPPAQLLLLQQTLKNGLNNRVGAAKRAIKLLRHISVYHCKPTDFDDITWALATPWVQAALKSTPTIAPALLKELRSVAHIVIKNGHLIQLLSRNNLTLNKIDLHVHVKYALNIQQLGEMLGFNDASLTISRLQTLEQLQYLHERWTKRLLKTSPSRHLSHFGPAPISGTNTIIPLSSATLIHEESSVMQHCAEGLAHQIACGKSYLYRILEPERATLEIVKKDNGEWRITQLKRENNLAAGSQTYTAILNWLENATPTAPQ